MAGTLEHMVHVEALKRLNISYQANGYYVDDDVLSIDEGIKVLETYMIVYILAYLHNNLDTLSVYKIHEMESDIMELYPSWPETQEFVREVFDSVKPSRDYIYFHELEHVVSEIGERYGAFQNKECRRLKNTLVDIEDSGIGDAGRVRISDFYESALKGGNYQFSENIDYLRTLGALDDSDAFNPRVIISNYIYGPSNCVASSDYYSVCCLDECEDILSQLEQSLAAPEAAPAVIISIVQTISSATMPSNRAISTWLQRRLNEIAMHHGGLVPLHGRLFAQWLHYAYPRECQFPHVAGTINPLRPEDILKEMNVTEGDIAASEASMKQFIEAAAPAKRRVPGATLEIKEESGMWSLDEELVVWRPVQHQSTKGTVVRRVAFIGTALSFAVALKAVVPTSTIQQKGLSDKLFV